MSGYADDVILDHGIFGCGPVSKLSANPLIFLDKSTVCGLSFIGSHDEGGNRLSYTIGHVPAADPSDVCDPAPGAPFAANVPIVFRNGRLSEG